MKHKPTEKGQALVIIALAAVVLIGFAALAIDGSMAFSDRRHAQNAADTAAMAGALAFTRGDDVTAAAEGRATDNSYTHNGTTKFVTVTSTDVPTGTCPGNAPGKDITVDISSIVNTTFARIVGRTQLTNTVTATARGCGYIVAPLFPGSAIVSLNSLITQQGNNYSCAFELDGGGTWTIEGGGIFSNGCADQSNNTTVILDPGDCVTTPSITDPPAPVIGGPFPCTGTASSINYSSVAGMMPPNPCDGTVGDVGLPQSSGVTSGDTVSFSSGVYCISNMDALDSMDIVLNNATLYVTDDEFNLKFAGGGGFSGTATTSGTYSNYYMIIDMVSPPCNDFTSQDSQVINYRGNGSGTLQGTILAPSACVDLRGNSQTSNVINSQVIAYNVSGSGNASIHIVYDPDENHQDPHEPSISLLK